MISAQMAISRNTTASVEETASWQPGLAYRMAIRGAAPIFHVFKAAFFTCLSGAPECRLPLEPALANPRLRTLCNLQVAPWYRAGAVSLLR